MLELTVWPGGERRTLAHVDYHGAWLEWRRVISSRDNEKLKLVRKLHERRWRGKTIARLTIRFCAGPSHTHASEAVASRALLRSALVRGLTVA